jgi:hypothetical protein
VGIRPIQQEARSIRQFGDALVSVVCSADFDLRLLDQSRRQPGCAFIRKCAATAVSGHEITMSKQPPISQLEPSDDSNATFLIRWRGKQEGPYTAAVIEGKLAANQIGLLHEISHNGQWVALRDFFAERAAIIRLENQARQEAERRDREEAERQTREREERLRSDILSEERRKNDLLQASMAERQRTEAPGQTQQIILKPHRAGTILALGLVGLLICGPLCAAAWFMGDSDIREMDAGLMDKSGRSTTSTGRALGVLGVFLWIIGIICFIAFK